MSRRRRGRALVTWLVILAVTISVLVAGGAWLAGFLRTVTAPGLQVGCQTVVAGQSYKLTTDQAGYAALISAISVQRGMPARAASIALATALQESKLRNLSYGDMDSLGLFQQRPSQEWGTAAEIMDPAYASNAFYDALQAVTGYETMPITEAAQLVQRSAYPDAYAKHEDLAKAFASALTGQSAGALNCTLPPVAAAGSPDDVVAALAPAFGSVPSTVAPAADGSTVVSVDAKDQLGWSVAQWAVANANTFNITSVSYAGQQWVRSDVDNNTGTNVGWHAAPKAPAQLRITVNTP
jgi:hypothetical protein